MTSKSFKSSKSSKSSQGNQCLKPVVGEFAKLLVLYDCCQSVLEDVCDDGIHGGLKMNDVVELPHSCKIE